jgi:hypothetical protein
MNEPKSTAGKVGWVFCQIIKWTLIIAFFPMSLVFVAYARQRKAKKEYYRKKE